MATISTDIAQKIDIIARENNTSTINLIITDSSGSPFNLALYEITFTIYDETGTHITKSKNNGITNTSYSYPAFTNGKISINLSANDLGILPKTYKHKLVFIKNTTINGESVNVETKTWMYGKFKINND